MAADSASHPSSDSFSTMTARAREVRQLYAASEARRYGRSWTPEELALGLVGDVGDLAKLVQGKAGVRERADLDAALAHELADCLWSVMVLADCYGIDLGSAFHHTMDVLQANLTGDASSDSARTDAAGT